MALEAKRPRNPSGSPAYPERRGAPWATVAAGRILAAYCAEWLTHIKTSLTRAMEAARPVPNRRPTRPFASVGWCTFAAMEKRDPRRRPYRPHIRALDAPTDRDLAHIYAGMPISRNHERASSSRAKDFRRSPVPSRNISAEMRTMAFWLKNET